MKDFSNKNLNKINMSGVATKPQTIKNTMGRGGGYFNPGTAPSGGYQSMWCFGENKGDFKNSPVSKPEKGSV